MDLVFSQAGMLGSELPPGISPKKHFYFNHFKEQELSDSEDWVLSVDALSPRGSFGCPTFRIQPWQNSCRNVHIFIPFLWFLPWGKTDRRRKEMWESVCVLVLICWKRGLWEPFLCYGNVMNEGNNCFSPLSELRDWFLCFCSLVFSDGAISWRSFIIFFLFSLFTLPFPFSLLLFLIHTV